MLLDLAFWCSCTRSHQYEKHDFAFETFLNIFEHEFSISKLASFGDNKYHFHVLQFLQGESTYKKLFI